MSYLEQAKTIEDAVFQALGAASACWENLEGAGVFQSERCKAIGDELLARIREAGHDHGTLNRVYDGLQAAGLRVDESMAAVSEMQNRGILFRERMSE